MCFELYIDLKLACRSVKNICKLVNHSNSGVLKLYCVSESPGRRVKHQLLEPTPDFWIPYVWNEAGKCISNEFLSD